MTRFRPCIDLHEGEVKQVVGGTLGDEAGPRVNFVATHGPGWFAEKYRSDGLVGGHVIQLGPGNEQAARQALGAWPGGMQLGGGVTPATANPWLDAGASHVIVTSYLFDGPELSMERVRSMARCVGRDRLVIDLSCRKRGDAWHVATNRWQTVTETTISLELLSSLADHCAEFLVHAADVEGLCNGIDEDLVALLGDATPLPCTYAGGAKHLDDLTRVQELSGGRVDLTFGSALDIFGGRTVRYDECVQYNRGASG